MKFKSGLLQIPIIQFKNNPKRDSEFLQMLPTRFVQRAQRQPAAPRGCLCMLNRSALATGRRRQRFLPPRLFGAKGFRRALTRPPLPLGKVSPKPPRQRGTSGTWEVTESLLGGCHHLDRVPAQHPPTPPPPPAGTCQATSWRGGKKKKKKKSYQTSESNRARTNHEEPKQFGCSSIQSKMCMEVFGGSRCLSGLIWMLFWSADLCTYCRAQLATAKGGQKIHTHMHAHQSLVSATQTAAPTQRTDDASEIRRCHIGPQRQNGKKRRKKKN